ncbi:Protein STIP1 homolog [Durusdinium trenchii]|uniref:Protein STIP1 homolog n=1 Tax=Durusdinium trenchii TaxID=1381693 RepID=A0ABP0JDC7_9DINO
MDGEQPESFAELRRLNQDLRGVEGRQVLLDRRLVELDAQVQALQEQHMAQSFAAECGQRAVALGAHRALQTAKEVQEEGEWKKCMEVLGIDSESESQRTAQRMQQELVSVSRRIEEMGERMEVHLAHNVRSGETTRLQARLSALEQSHRKLAVGAQRALRMALSVHEKQEWLGPSGNPYANNRHADVLNEEPVDEAAKLRLCEEVKNRAKGSFVQKDMPSAELLYGKAISLLASLPGKSEAALYSNRSMVRLNLNKVEGALEDANKCIELDPKFVKAYHRKAQALIRLSEWEQAIQAAEEGSKLEPDNKSFQELIDKAQKDKEKDVADKARLKADAQDVRVELHNASTARAPPKPKDKDKENEFSEMRGYKKTADGKTTSYFHTDISDEAKKLIEAQGFGKPQKLDAPVEKDDVKGGGSQWNQAGTYEEKGMTKWLEDRLKSGLVGVKFELPRGGSISTTGVADLKGDCSISVSRGKRRHLMDVSFNVEYEATVGDSNGRGKLSFSEVTTEDDPEVKNEPSSDVPPAIREVLDAFVKPAGQGLQPLLLAEVKKMIEDYKGQ